MANKLKQITTKAKQLYKTGKFAKWTDAIKAASKQTASVGATKKKTEKKKIGALPIGFTGSFWGVKFKVVNQFDIYGDVNSYVETLQTGFKIITFDGKGSAADKAQILFEYVLRHGKPYGVDTEKNRKELKSKILSFCNNMQKEVKDYNAGKKKTIKKQPINVPLPKIKKQVVKKETAKKITRKKNTHWKTVNSHKRRVNGIGTHKDNKSHNVRISVMSGTPKSSFNMLKVWENVYGKLAQDYISSSNTKEKQKIKKEMITVKLIISDIKKIKSF